MTSTQTPVELEPRQRIRWLDGIRVVECTIGVSTPLSARVLSDLGADVVRLESRAKPDVNRTRLTRRAEWRNVPAEESFGLLHEANAGKRSALLDLKNPRGRDLFVEMVAGVDVFVQNFVPGWLERLNLSINLLRERNPSLIVLSASCYGQRGPGSRQRAYAPVMTALGGVEGLIGYEDGEVQGTMASALADLNAAYVGAFALLAALRERERTGRGCHLDLSQTESAAILIGEAMVEYQLTGQVPGPSGNAGMSPRPWHTAWCQVSGDWIAFTGPDASAADEFRVDARRMTSEQAVSACRTRGWEAAVVAESPPGQLATDGSAAELADIVSHPMLGSLAVTALPWTLDGVRPALRSASPLLGGETDEVVRDLVGLDADALALLHEAGAFE